MTVNLQGATCYQNYEMSFLSLNVCGLKNKHIIKEFDEYILKHDLIGFQETKLSMYDEVHIENYEIFTKNRVSRTRMPSGGIALAVKNTISKYVTILSSDSNLVLWFKLSRQIANLEADILCGVVYIPPEYTKYSSADPFTEIQNELDSFKHNFSQVLLFGDFNARTGKLDEFVTPDSFLLDELHLEALQAEYEDEISIFERNNICTGRTTQDKHTNNYGYKMIEFCRENSFFILNGRLGDDKTLGNTTCRHVSCIDYFVCNVNMFDFCCNLSVDEFCPLLSDVHRPISLKFRIKTDINDYASQTNHAQRKSKL